jgi:hypothetical protein
MGSKPSPYYAVAFFYLAEEFVRGCHLEEDNPLRWDYIVLNIPGDLKYTPTKSRVFKWDRIGKHIAGEVAVFMDDLRGTGPTVEHTWRVSRRTASRLQFLGNQDAARKRRPPTQRPGAWAGSVFRTSSNSVSKSVTLEKWKKAKQIVKSLRDIWLSDENSTLYDYKELERARGFSVHLSMTYDMLRHHLKGFHLTLAAHGPNRGDDGWKIGDRDRIYYVQSKLDANEITPEEAHLMIHPTTSTHHPPKLVKPLPQLVDDIYALSEFLSPDNPPEIEDRNSEVRVLLYGFADASGGGLGSSVQIPGTGIRCRTGVWGKDEEGTSSNFKEFNNVILTVEEEAKEGTLNGAQMFLFTDNATVEAALYKGNTSNRKLFELIVRIRKVQMECNATILVSHVSRKRMVAQGTDWISRGELKEGIAQGESKLSFIPLHLSALERTPDLKKWISSWVGPKTEFLTPNEWFTRGHDHDGGVTDTKGFWRPNL